MHTCLISQEFPYSTVSPVLWECPCGTVYELVGLVQYEGGTFEAEWEVAL